jgi:myosin V
VYFKILELKPSIAVKYLPNLPAYIIFMCIRYADLFNHSDRIKSFLNSILQAIKRLIKVFKFLFFNLYLIQF